MSRRRAHIAMVGIPAVSHVLPSLEIIRELVIRGHRVTYANDPDELAARMRAVAGRTEVLLQRYVAGEGHGDVLAG